MPLLSCVAFSRAYDFNADLSKWQTGAVTTMRASEYTNLCVVTFVECSKVFCFCHSFLFLLVVCVLFLHLLFFVRLLSCVAFESAYKFNADITHWNVGAVTDMTGSKSSKKNIFCVFSFPIFKNINALLLTPFL